MTAVKRKELHTPDGLKDFMPGEYAFKFETERRITEVFHRYGYVSVCSPTLEYMEVFDGCGTNTRQAYKFIDRNGEILILRPDMTPAIARIAATHCGTDDIPMRFCYVGNNFRYNENYQGKQREFTQAGIELIGHDGTEADGEILAVAINALLGAGLTDFRLDLGHVQFLAGALEEAGFDDDTAAMLQEKLIAKEYADVERFVISKDIPHGVKKIFTELPLLTGDISIITAARAMASGEKALRALSELESIYKVLKSYGLCDYVLFDLGMTGHLDYYTGMIVRGYTYGTGFSVLDGGRYNNLISYFGSNLPSVGFAIKINDLVCALENQSVTIEMDRADTLLAYTEAGRDMALAAGDELRRKGVYIENSLIGGDMEKVIEYARKKQMGGILYFTGDGEVSVIDLQNGDTVNVSIERLLNGEGIE